MSCLVDGQPAASISLADRGLAYGDGLFETMRVQQGKIALLDYHLKRLRNGCQRLLIEPDWPALEQEIQAFAAQHPNGVCKLILTRGDGQRGYGLPQSASPRRILQAAQLPQWPASHARDGVQLFPCKTRLAIQPALAGLKHLNRLEQVLARAEWQNADYAEGLMLDTQGRVIEGVFSNLFLVRSGQLYTAELSGSGVAGIMRTLILEIAQWMKLAAHVVELYPEDLQAADEVFTCNSLYGIWPVIGCADWRWPVGPLTRRLQESLKSSE